MSKQNIAIIGLGRIGSAFFDALQQKQKNINLVCVSERVDTPAKARAEAAGIRVCSLDEVVGMGDAVDIIFDLTGLPAVRRELRAKLRDADNGHTVIASESITRLIWALIGEEALPFIEGRKIGY
jgi:predicted dinucleotide-utilizing enzyme